MVSLGAAVVNLQLTIQTDEGREEKEMMKHNLEVKA